MLIALLTLASAVVAWLRGGRLTAFVDRPLGPLTIFRLQAVPTLLLGILCNGLVMVLNGGRMPVSLTAAAITGADTTFLVQGQEVRHTLLHAGTRLPLLADVVGLPSPLSRVVSIGDLLIVVSIIFVVQDFMGVRVRLWPSRRPDDHNPGVPPGGVV